MKPCPFCAEEIKDEANVCHFCGRDLVKKDYSDCPKCRKNRIILRSLILILIFVGVFVCGMGYAYSFSG